MKASIKFTGLRGDFSSTPAASVDNVDEVLFVKNGLVIRVYSKDSVWNPLVMPDNPDQNACDAAKPLLRAWYDAFRARFEEAFEKYLPRNLDRYMEPSQSSILAELAKFGITTNDGGPSARTGNDGGGEEDGEDTGDTEELLPAITDLTIDQARELCDAQGIAYARNAGLAALQAKLADAPGE